jgi:F0F1-type ATP synthase alpha subunit
MENSHAKTVKTIKDEKQISDETRKALAEAIDKFKKERA